MMKKQNLTVPISLTATLALIVTGALSCGKKNNSDQPAGEPSTPPATNTAAAETNAPATDTNVTAISNLNTNPAIVAAPEPAITNPPPATTTPTAVATPEPAPTAPPATVVKIVEMPATVPTAPTNFYAGELAPKPCCEAVTNQTRLNRQANENYFFRFRAGYEHISYLDNNDSYTLGVKFYAHGDDLRAWAGKNSWLIPDFDAEMSYHLLAKPEGNSTAGTQTGSSVRADFFWPWLHWTTGVMSRSNNVCPFCRPLALGFGPVASVGYDRLANSSDYQLARYFGVRMTIARDGFIEYAAGGTDGLTGTRQQVTAELPFYTSRDGEVRYYFRGQWNYAGSHKPDILSGGLFVEMPFSTLVKPSKWSDLVPFAK